ncbi:protein-methionine-sulfoxide reductase heme-binding subunit MsrQ [Litoreibacter arenae]|uniref:Protein-methionine-sulfoxide reductase heme-binding subunit MsrQ n=1 Tax=Litoreibacter arenae DSM 19593 TaxID=1123360 RepID=S9QDA9_9RHOB|nr:protein-methionine-sulfoxide reductase heme-binding subunit MsrQ [Litoreibacter arenae]EPX77917.1 Membrane protein YedZ [Litoreibacter arenae DSM 19593]
MAHSLTLPERVNAGLRTIPNWVVYLLGALPGLYIVVGVALALLGIYDLFGNRLGVDPIRTIEHWLGELALQFFIATMLISILRDYFRLKLIKFRRALGLLTFFYVILHLSVWISLDLQFRWGEAWADILKRPYITIGMAGFVLLIPLAVTSSNAMIRRLGPVAWQRLHKLAYPAILLGGIHYVMVQKVWEAEPLIYLAIILVLLGLRGRRLIR